METGQAVTSEPAKPVEASSAENVEAGSKPLAAEFECSICYDLLLEPVVGNCGHDFCKHCYEKWFRIARKASCPICRKPLPKDLGVCVRLKNTIENLFPQRVRERQRQVAAAITEECAKKPRTGTFSLTEVLANHMPGVPMSFENTVAFERPAAVMPSEGQPVRAQPVDDIAPHVTLFFERMPGPPLRHYAAIGSTGTALQAGLVPVQFGRHSTPPALPQLPLGPSLPTISRTTQGEMQGIGIPAIPTVPAAAAVLSVPAAITMPQWLSALSRSSPISFRPAIPSTLQHLLTPALVLSPTPAPVPPAMAQAAAAHWVPPLENVVFTMAMYQRDPQARRRFLRRRLRAQNV